MSSWSPLFDDADGAAAEDFRLCHAAPADPGPADPHPGPRAGAPTYHTNALTFLSAVLDDRGWRRAAPGAAAAFGLWLEPHRPGGGARRAPRSAIAAWPRAALERLNDKCRLARYLREAGLEGDGIPRTYLSVAELLAAAAGPGDARASGEAPRAPLYFLKYALVEAAMGVQCFHAPQDVARAVADQGIPEGTYVIQREVADLLLLAPSPAPAPATGPTTPAPGGATAAVASPGVPGSPTWTPSAVGHKCSVRAYLVVWRQELYLWTEYLVKIHAAPYTRDSLSKDVHVESRAAGAGVRPVRGTALGPLGAAMLEEMARLCDAKLSGFAGGLRSDGACGARYAILGLDFLFSRRGGAARPADAGAGPVQGWLIECNYAPCLWDTAAFTNRLKRELMDAFYTAFLAPNAAAAAAAAAGEPASLAFACNPPRVAGAAADAPPPGGPAPFRLVSSGAPGYSR